MKKIGLFLSAAALLMASCADKDAYTVTGTVAGGEVNGSEVYLQELNEDGRGFTNVDTAKVENGTFTFKGVIPGEKPAIRFISIAGAPAKIARPALFILEPGNISVSIDSVSTVKGTPLNGDYQVFASKRDEINNKIRSISVRYSELSAKGEFTPEMETKLNEEFESYSKEMSGVLFDYTKANITNPVGEFFFKSAGNSFDEVQLKELLSLATPQFKEDKAVQQLEKYLLALEGSAIGKQFIDVKGNTPEGQPVALSDYAGKGKVVLIDFWASWCGPCIKEMPTVVAAYKKYKSKGLEIVGISLDTDKAAWEKSIKDLGITWPQMSDLKGWESELSQPYAVRGIPHTVLLDKDGKILLKDLRGEDLLKKLDELLK